MTKKELSNDLRRHGGGSGFITRKKLADYFGVAEPRVIDIYLDGLERVSGKYYFIDDVSENIMKHRSVGGCGAK